MTHDSDLVDPDLDVRGDIEEPFVVLSEFHNVVNSSFSTKASESLFPQE
jgi:hypothetical protein